MKMAEIKTIYKGESVTLLFTFPEAYDMARIASHKIFVGETEFTGVIEGQTIKLQLKSSDTNRMIGTHRIVCLIDDTTLGLRKPYCGELVIAKTQASGSTASVSNISDIIIPIVISETAITVGDILYNYVKGDPFTYSDFTPEQIAELQQPATSAIVSIQAVEQSVEQAEALRVQADLNRQTNTATAIQNAETATTWANNAAILANEKAGLANNAAILANEKATLANDAATLANTKAGLADAAATNANNVANGYATELAAKELKANKQNSLAPDGTGTKFPTVDAVNAGLNLKSNKLPFSTYIHSGNKEVYISSVDVDTNTFTSVSHGLVNTNEVYITFQDNLSNLIAGSVMPGGMTTKPTGSFYVINKTNDTFQLSLTNGGVAIDLTTNANMDLSKWHFEKIIDTVNITGIPASTKSIRAILSGRNVQPSVTGVGIIRINEMPYDTKWYSGTGFFYPINDCYGTIYHYLVVEIDTNMLLKVSVSGFRISHNTISANTNEIINKSSIYSDISYKNVDISKVVFTNIRLANGAKIELYTL